MAAEQTVDIKRGLDASARAMEIGEHLKNDAIWTNAAVEHATYLLRSGRLKEAYRLYDAAWEKADRLNDGFQAAWLGRAATRGWRCGIRSRRSGGTYANLRSHGWHMLRSLGKPSKARSR